MTGFKPKAMADSPSSDDLPQERNNDTKEDRELFTEKSPARPSWLQRWKPFALALCAFIVYWMSLDPLRLEYTILLVPALWYPLYFHKSRQVAFKPVEKKRRHIVWRCAGCFVRFPGTFYGQLWLASILFWSVVAFWLTCPHPATILGWAAVAVYIGVYFPIFIALTRLLVTRLPYSIAVAPAAAWLVTEWFRKHLMGGFSFASLEHAFYRHPILIQTADLYGEYTVGTLIVLLGTGLALTTHLLKKSQYVKACITFAYLAILTAAAVAYGVNRFDSFVQVEQTARQSGKKVRVILLQEPTTFRFPVPEETNQRIHHDYLDLAAQAVEREDGCDLIVWPESSFMFPWVEIPPEGVPHEWARLTFPQRMEQIAQVIGQRDKKFQHVPQSLHSAVLLGSTTIEYGPAGHMDFLNSAIFVPQSGSTARYDKMQLVIFGEYLPFADYLPDWFPLKTLCNSVKAGEKAVAFTLYGQERTVLIAPNICFESSIPHLVWNQVKQLRSQGQDPDLLINMSNDGWFQYMPQIEYHLAAHVFRAIENRKHFLSATHAGFAAWVDPAGRIRACGDRKKAQAVVADIYGP